MTYEFEDINMNEINQEAAAINKDSTVMDMFVKMPEKDGFIVLRFLPPMKGKPLFTVTRLHTMGNKRFHCTRVRKHLPNGTFWVNGSGNPADDCPICLEYSRLWKVSNNQTGEQQTRTQTQARSIKPIERYYWNVIVRQQINTKTGQVEKNVGPKILSCGKTLQSIVLESINGSELTGRPKLGNVTHPVTGRDFRIIKKIVKGSGGSEYPKYDQSRFEDPSSLGEDGQIKTWIDAMHDLEALKQYRPRPEMIEAMKEHFGGAKSTDSTSVWEESAPNARVSVSVPASPVAAMPPSQPPVEETTTTKAPSVPPTEDIDSMIDDEFNAAVSRING
jgi:hypothetical protein